MLITISFFPFLALEYHIFLVSPYFTSHSLAISFVVYLLRYTLWKLEYPGVSPWSSLFSFSLWRSHISSVLTAFNLTLPLLTILLNPRLIWPIMYSASLPGYLVNISNYAVLLIVSPKPAVVYHISVGRNSVLPVAWPKNKNKNTKHETNTKTLFFTAHM